MSILIYNIKELVQVKENPGLKVAGKAMAKLNTIKDAWLLIEGDRIKDFGPHPPPPDPLPPLLKERGPGGEVQLIDASDRFVFPSFCDSHTHLVYAGSREIEYID